MAGRHFLSVLGTSNYSKVTYRCDEGTLATEYIQEAVLKLKMLNERGFGADDRITIFVTKEAYRLNWLDRDYTDRELKQMGAGKETARKTGLYSILQKEFGITEESVRFIPLGATEDELWDIFNIMYDEIQDEEELYVDITHSLRNIPIQMLSVITYARTLKNINVAGIYYGAFEAKVQNEAGETEAPIFDLVTFLDILDWSQAAGSFVRYGNSDEIKALFDIQKVKRSNKMADSYKVVNDLYDITQGLETSRGCHVPDKKGVPGGSVLNSYRSYEQNYKAMQKRVGKQEEAQARKNRIEPLSKLFDVIHDKLGIFDVEDNLAFGFAAIDWAIENKKTQQGFTALDETIKTYLCCRYGLNEYLEKHREGIAKSICNLVNNEMRQKESGKELTAEAREDIFRKWEIAWEMRWGREQNGKDAEPDTVTPEQERKAARMLTMELPVELAELTSAISSRRNSMNHFGYSNIYQFGCRKLYEDLKEYYGRFRQMIAPAKEREEE